MSSSKEVADLVRLVLVTDQRLLRGRDLPSVCREAEEGGVTAVLVRAEEAGPRELATTVRAVLAAVRIPVLVGSRADVAIAGGAAGVHLTPEDVPVALVRRISPSGFLVGTSVAAADQVESGRGADYWVVGPVRSAGDGLGGGGLDLATFSDLVRRGEGRPCVAIGGVRPEDVGPVIQAGGTGVAVSSGILAAQEAGPAARAYREVLDTAPASR